jgi:hypothetical protein
MHGAKKRELTRGTLRHGGFGAGGRKRLEPSFFEGVHYVKQRNGNGYEYNSQE